jgi:methionyl-tRNA formyltransferase
MRIAFVGAVEGSLVALDALVGAGAIPALVITLPREASERHSDFADLAAPAHAAGAAVCFATNINAPETIAALQHARPDLTLVIGWSQICRGPFRAVARLGTLGYHPAPLPRFRGRAVIPWTILANETETGSTIFWLDEGVDSGPILAQELFAVAPDETARSLYEKHKHALARLVPQAIGAVAGNGRVGTPQDHELATYCAKRTAEDGLIDWREPAADILRLIRAVGDPYAGAFTFGNGERIVIDAARAFAPRGRYLGIPGQVQGHTDKGFTIFCGDGSTVEATAWRGPRPKIHTKLMSLCIQAKEPVPSAFSAT